MRKHLTTLIVQAEVHLSQVLTQKSLKDNASIIITDSEGRKNTNFISLISRLTVALAAMIFTMLSICNGGGVLSFICLQILELKQIGQLTNLN